MTLEEQRNEFKSRRLLATPISGTIVWLIIGVSSVFLNDFWSAMVLFAGTGSIVYIAFGISRLTGENMLDKNKPKNAFDGLFLYSIFMAALVYSIAIPFFIIDHTSLPLSVGILTGLMWLQISWIVQHWIGVFHAVARTVLVLAAWYIFPEDRFIAVPAVIVLVYIISIYVLETRWRKLQTI